MFFNLYIKECGAVLKSIIYFAFVGVVILFYLTQLGNYVGQDIKQFNELTPEEANSNDSPFIKPLEGSEDYGTKHAEIPAQVMEYAINMLEAEYRANNFVTYPVGFYKTVKLNEKQLTEIASILDEVAALSDRDYELFKEKMITVDKMLGGGSIYSPDNFKRYGKEPVTYEEKLGEYNSFIHEDKISGAYARLFCDYMGIIIALFSVFVPTAFMLRDRNAKINELIYSRKLSTSKLIAVRYFSLASMTLLPILVLSILPTAQLAAFGAKSDFGIDMLAFLKYIAAWLLPTALATTAIGVFFTVLTDTPIAIIVQFIYSFIGIFTGVGNLEGGNYGFELSIRHNSLGNAQLVSDSMSRLLINRISYTLAALLLLLVTIRIYEMKRRGRLDIGGSLQKIFRAVKGANKA